MTGPMTRQERRAALMAGCITRQVRRMKMAVPRGRLGLIQVPQGLRRRQKAQGRTWPGRGGEDAEILPDVTESQKAVLDKIVKALEAQDLETAAQVMDSGEEELVTLFYEVMDGARYLYDGRSFSQSMEGEGLVLTMPKTLYYGTFKGGRPEGECTGPSGG